MALYKLNLHRKVLKEDQPTGAEAQGKKIVIILHKGKIYALNAVCTHMGAPLDKGKVKGEELICPWHSGAYFIATGKADENTKWVHDTQTYRIVEDASGELSADI